MHGQVFWLPDQPSGRAFPPRFGAAVACLRLSSPVTAAGPRRNLTVFPVRPLRAPIAPTGSKGHWECQRNCRRASPRTRTMANSCISEGLSHQICCNRVSPLQRSEMYIPMRPLGSQYFERSAVPPISIGSRCCPLCGGMDVRRPHRRNAWERILSVFGISPYRCRNCLSRFYLVFHG